MDDREQRVRGSRDLQTVYRKSEDTDPQEVVWRWGGNDKCWKDDISCMAHSYITGGIIMIKIYEKQSKNIY